ncbi:hypothetical protein [Streptomyces sp. BP-8]|uniref:Uncharacterized protein n=1 Tax=Streptomyces sirii TaxID=3127701 RepID=A0ABZ2QY77_9ACTN
MISSGRASLSRCWSSAHSCRHVFSSSGRRWPPERRTSRSCLLYQALVRHTDGGVAVVCGPSWATGSDGIILLEVQPENGRPQPATSLLSPGARLS